MIKEEFQKAKENKYALGAFNFSNLEIVKAIIKSAHDLKTPVILSTSEGEGKYFGKKQARAIIDSFKKETGLPIFLHLDHGKSLESVQEAIEAGYDSIHFDGTKMSFEENMEETKKIVDFAREKGIQNIEGEINYFKGASAIHEDIELKEEDMTTPEQAQEYVQKTGVDSLAIAIGNIHGITKNKEMENPHLNLKRLEEIDQALEGKIFLVLHGGSGTPEEDIKKAVQLGIVKVNVNTEMRVAYRKAMEDVLKENPNQVTPYKLMPPVVEAVEKVVLDKIKLFNND